MHRSSATDELGADAPALLRLDADVPGSNTTTACESSLFILTSASVLTRMPSPSSSAATPIPSTSTSDVPPPRIAQTPPPLLAHTTIAAITVAATDGVCLVAFLLWLWLRRLRARHEAAARAAREKLLAANGGTRRGKSRGATRRVRWGDGVDGGEDLGRGRDGRVVDAVRRRRRLRERENGGAGVADGSSTVGAQRVESDRRNPPNEKSVVVTGVRSGEDGNVKKAHATRRASGYRWQQHDSAAASARERRARRRGGGKQRSPDAGNTEDNDAVRSRYAPTSVPFSDKWTRDRRQRATKNPRKKEEKKKREEKAEVPPSNLYDLDDGVDEHGEPGGPDLGDERDDSSPELGPDDSASLHAYRMAKRAEAEAERDADDHDGDSKGSDGVDNEHEERVDGYIPYEFELQTKRRIRRLRAFIDWAEGGAEGRAETERLERSLERQQDEMEERARNIFEGIEKARVRAGAYE